MPSYLYCFGDLVCLLQKINWIGAVTEEADAKELNLIQLDELNPDLIKINPGVVAAMFREQEPEW